MSIGSRQYTATQAQAGIQNYWTGGTSLPTGCRFPSPLTMTGEIPMPDSTVERVAKAMHKVDRIKEAAEWQDVSSGDKWGYRTMAQAAIDEYTAIMREKDLVPVVRETPLK